MYLKTAGIERCLCCNKNIDGMIIYDLYRSIQEDEGLYSESNNVYHQTIILH